MAITVTPPTPKEILKKVFGYDEFRPLQAEAIHNILAHKDTLIVMPTGGGKSLCYQIPALLFSGITIVVSPLISLMQDQVSELQKKKVPALFINSSLTSKEYKENARQVLNNEIKLLYLAPETLMKEKFLELLSKVKVDCVAIDEAHCISEWGHDFRPEYRQLLSLRRVFPKAAFVALTATATVKVRREIKSSLAFAGSAEFITSFNRPNLRFSVVNKTDPLAQTVYFLEKFPKKSPGIIYCFSRKQVDELTNQLRLRGYAARSYHAGLTKDERAENQRLFLNNNVQIVVATIAFGMGINKPNVRFVIHYDLPKSLEGYYQEIGRAGRDGLPAHCVLFYSDKDINKVRYFLNKKTGPARRAEEAQLDALLTFIHHRDCRRRLLLAYFGERTTEESCGGCDNCLREAKQKKENLPVNKSSHPLKSTTVEYKKSNLSVAVPQRVTTR